MNSKDILILDDDIDLAMIASDALEDYGYTVEIAESIEKAYSLMEETKFKLIILDINLPEGTGFDFCTEIRKESTIPIIFISARTSDTDKVRGLDIGGDDYLPKPYSLAELLSRVNANMRRAYGFAQTNTFKFGDIEADLNMRTVKRNGQTVNLSIK